MYTKDKTPTAYDFLRVFIEVKTAINAIISYVIKTYSKYLCLWKEYQLFKTFGKEKLPLKEWLFVLHILIELGIYLLYFKEWFFEFLNNERILRVWEVSHIDNSILYKLKIGF